MYIFILLSCLAPAVLSAEPTCGGSYRGFQYTITSPNYPYDYPGQQNCIYHLQGDTSSECEQEFHLQFQDFNVRPSDNCKDDYLQVGERNIFCGTVTGLRQFTGRNNTLTITFRSDEKDAAKGFKILVTALPCSLKLNPLKNHASIIDLSSSKNGVNGKIGDFGNPPARFAFPSSTGDVISSKLQSLESTSEQKLPHITSYLFLPPNEKATIFKNDASDFPASLPNELLPPSSRPATNFKSSGQLSKNVAAPTAWDKSSTSQSHSFVQVPSRNFGESSFGVVDYDLQVGRDCDKSTDVLSSQQPSDVDFPPKINYNSQSEFQGDASRLGSSSNLLYDPRQGLLNANGYQSGIYQQQSYIGPNYPSTYQSPNAYSTFPSVNYQSNFYPSSYPYNAGWNAAGWAGGLNAQSGECCRLQTGRRFLLSSPGFPSSASSAYTCRYTITKASPDVCRLRMNFRFFNFGVDDTYCNYGFLEIDGRRYCGCKSGQSIQVAFTEPFAKSAVLAYANYPRTKFSGFVIDVIQESCGASGSYPGYYPPSYSCPPSYPSYPSYPSIPSYPSYPCNSQRPYDPHNPIYSPFLQRRQGTTNSSSSGAEARTKRDLGYSYSKPSVPFFEREVDVISPITGNQPRDRIFGGSCQSRLFVDWVVASKEVVLRNGRCERFGIYRSASDRLDADAESLAECEEIGDVQGSVKSPSYPRNYPDGIDKCYRFVKAPNFCKLELHFENFDLETSQECVKDYLSFNEDDERYCGRSLNNYKPIFDLTLRNFVEIHFASDDQGNGNGFNILFSQQPCETPTMS